MNLNQWKKKGMIALWSHEPKDKNFSGWHMHANEDGYCSIEEYLSALFTSPIECWRTIELNVLGKDNLCGKPYDQVPASKLVIKHHAKTDGWSFERQDIKVIFSIGKSNQERVLKGINLAKSGEYDFSIGSKKGESLWFW